MKSEYFLILLGILLFPLPLSILLRVRMYTHWKALLKAVLLVSAVYWTWDILVTARGHWSFSPDYVVGWTILGMPVEEWLFFPVVAFVSVFTFEATRKVLKRR